LVFICGATADAGKKDSLLRAVFGNFKAGNIVERRRVIQVGDGDTEG
jgi:hypothetical protein